MLSSFSEGNISANLVQPLKNQVAVAHRKQGRHEEPSFLIIDAQSVKNTDTTVMSKGYDVGKKVSGINRHIAVNTRGLPHALR